MSKQRGKQRQKHVPLRTCVACRETKAKRELVRIVAYSEDDSEVRTVVDESGKLKGRGAYLCRRRACWEQALKRGTLSRALRTRLSPEDVAELEAFMETLPEHAEEESA
ncbi:MAG: RNase P modulator RnpM [Anaerolineae bacterium]